MLKSTRLPIVPWCLPFLLSVSGCKCDDDSGADDTSALVARGAEWARCLAHAALDAPFDLDCDGVPEGAITRANGTTTIASDLNRNGVPDLRVVLNSKGASIDHVDDEGEVTATLSFDASTGATRRTIPGRGGAPEWWIERRAMGNQLVFETSVGQQSAGPLPSIPASTPASTPVSAAGAVLGFSGCTSAQEAMLTQDFWAGYAKAYDCLRSRGSHLADDLAAMFQRAAMAGHEHETTPAQITCIPTPSAGGPEATAWFDTTENASSGLMRMGWYTDNKGYAASAVNTWAHELLHGIIPVHTPNHNIPIRDQVYACADFCTSGGDPADCYECFGEAAEHCDNKEGWVDAKFITTMSAVRNWMTQEKRIEFACTISASGGMSDCLLTEDVFTVTKDSNCFDGTRVITGPEQRHTHVEASYQDFGKLTVEKGHLSFNLPPNGEHLKRCTQAIEVSNACGEHASAGSEAICKLAASLAPLEVGLVTGGMAGPLLDQKPLVVLERHGRRGTRTVMLSQEHRVDSGAGLTYDELTTIELHWWWPD